MVELDTKRSQLLTLRTKYTERYPETLRVEREITQLEERIAEIRKSSLQAMPTQTTRRPVLPASAQAPQGYSDLAQQQYMRDMEELRRLRGQLEMLEKEISAARNERTQIQKSMQLFQAKVDASPRREQEMISLTRDYENLKGSYDDLLNKKLQADISENLEKRQKGEQFQILDPANLPEEPYVPNRKKIFLMAVLASILVGFGGAVALEGVDSTIRDIKDFRHYFNLPILATIPSIHDKVYERRLAFRKASIFGGLISFTLAVTIFLIVFGSRVRNILQGIR
jgi:uncharacterized protein involved in exopolysaccharide biosynthesis